MRLLLEAGADLTAEDVNKLAAQDLAKLIVNSRIERFYEGSNSQPTTIDENTENRSRACGLLEEKIRISILQTDNDKQDITQEELFLSTSPPQKNRVVHQKYGDVAVAYILVCLRLMVNVSLAGIYVINVKRMGFISRV